MTFLNDAVIWLNDITGSEFSIHGWIAFILGVIGVVAMNVGLMWLVVRSNRRGHDLAADEVVNFHKTVDKGD